LWIEERQTGEFRFAVATQFKMSTIVGKIQAMNASFSDHESRLFRLGNVLFQTRGLRSGLQRKKIGRNAAQDGGHFEFTLHPTQK